MNILRRNCFNSFTKFAETQRAFSKQVKQVDFDSLVKNNKVVVFMKGNPEEPRCGFSNAVVQILRIHNVKYEVHDVLSNDLVREGIKSYSNWPTIPQVYINGEFVGGCDILLQLHQNGELVQILKKAGIESALIDKPVADLLKEDAKKKNK